MKIGVVVVAGGRGERMGADVPKQFLALSDDRFVLEATVERFAEALPDARIAVVSTSGVVSMRSIVSTCLMSSPLAELRVSSR